MYNKLEEIEVSNKLDESIKKGMDEVRRIHRRQVIKKTAISVGTVTAAFTAFFVWGVRNPIIAAQIPIIGGIFQDIEKNVEFSGDFASKATKLEPNETIAKDADDKKSEQTNTDQSVIIAEDAIGSIQANEVYSDGTSIYLTLSIKSKETLSGISEPWVDPITGERYLSQLMIEGGSFTINQDNHVIDLCGESIEGEKVDENTFNGMLKLDISEFGLEKQDTMNLNLNINKITYTDMELMELEAKNMQENVTWGEDDEPIYSEDYQEINTFRTLEGRWNLVIPIDVDSENVYTYTINEEKDGFGIVYVTVTPYEVKVQTKIPKLYANHEEELAEKKAQYEEHAARAKEKGYEYNQYATDEEIDANISISTLGDYGAAVFDQNGEKLQYGYENITEDGYFETFSVKGRELTKLYIYIGEDGVSCFKENDQQAMADRAIFATEVDLTK